ncbi:hypothetical protein J1N35_000173 [Gossypium stocksii]|uniref:Reverse transcriptase domain-containing protein n=1 Tax=Gossypium stocksii TaxID=47602 RepID=A0A9D3WH68_9ROSI|nr:hypothetical protein J1N35_000173 [Gossypium stocksii]
MEFFERLYGEAPFALRHISNFGFPYLSPLEITFLEATITNEEIKRVLFNMAPLKAPENDGYHVYFFQSQWNTLGNGVCPAVSYLFFINDLVIFCKAQLDQVRLLDNILNQFYDISGHRISVRKSNIFFSKVTGVDVQNQITQMFRFQEVQNQ